MNKKLISSICLLFFFCLTHNLYAGKIIEEPAFGYFFSVPKLSSPDKILPVLVCLPGWGVQAKNDINLWAFPADKRGFMLLELDVDYSNANTEQVYQRIQDILHAASANYKIDKEEVFVAGTSAGGMMAISLALFHPERFKAIGVISGGRLSFGAENRLKNAQGKLFYFCHGQRDKSIPVGEFYSTKKQLEKNGAIIEFKVIPDGGHTLASSYYKELVDWFYQLTELSR